MDLRRPLLLLAALAVALAAGVVLSTSGLLGRRTETFPPLPPAAPGAAPTGCAYPAQVLDLTAWEVTLPTGRKDEPKEVDQPDLQSFVAQPWFTPVPTCNGIAFRAPVNGVTTSGSSYPRSELREMTPSGELAKWSSESGTHTLVVDEAFTKLPARKPHLVGAQIHDDDDDVSVFRLEGSNLYITKGNDAHHKLVTSSYALGTRFEAKFVVGGGTVRAYYDGVLQTTFTKRFSKAYFKAGAYTQANCEESAPCEDENYGETVIYGITVTHG